MDIWIHMKTNSDSWWPNVWSIGKKKKKNVLKIIVYNLSQQKRFFVAVTLNITGYRRSIILRHFRLQNGILTAIWWLKKFSVIAIFLGKFYLYLYYTRST